MQAASGARMGKGRVSARPGFGRVRNARSEEPLHRLSAEKGLKNT